MRLRTTSPFLIIAVLLSGMQTSSAQSPLSDHWCARHFGDWMVGPMSCYFSSYRQCRMKLSGAGGVCFQSPYYQPAPAILDGLVGMFRCFFGYRIGEFF
jgi:hypothetical protein